MPRTDINLLLTEREGLYWGILARGRGSTDRVQRGPYKNDRGPIPQYSLEQVDLVSSLLYGIFFRTKQHFR